jgi:hypothetical protein
VHRPEAYNVRDSSHGGAPQPSTWDICSVAVKLPARIARSCSHNAFIRYGEFVGTFGRYTVLTNPTAGVTPPSGRRTQPKSRVSSLAPFEPASRSSHPRPASSLSTASIPKGRRPSNMLGIRGGSLAGTRVAFGCVISCPRLCQKPVSFSTSTMQRYFQGNTRLFGMQVTSFSTVCLASDER